MSLSTQLSEEEQEPTVIIILDYLCSYSIGLIYKWVQIHFLLISSYKFWFEFVKFVEVSNISFASKTTQHRSYKRLFKSIKNLRVMEIVSLYKVTGCQSVCLSVAKELRNRYRFQERFLTIFILFFLKQNKSYTKVKIL